MKRIILMLFVLMFCGCGPDYSKCEFRPGDMVKSKLTDGVGQVIGMKVAYKRDWCYADVRFPGEQSYTDSKVLSNDGPITIQTLTVVTYMRPFELEHIK